MPLVRRGGGGAPPADTGGEAAADKLRSGTSDERWAAARDLAEQPGGVDVLADALSAETDPRVREAILTGLARIGTPRSAAAITPLIHSDDASLRTEAIDALRLMPAALAAVLEALLSDADSDVRLLACDLARQLPAQAATEILSDLLARETEANVCAAAVEVLAESGGPEALPALAACAERFAGVPFLAFSLKVAGDRIRAQAPARDG
jgi:HEAT repeat protein